MSAMAAAFGGMNRGHEWGVPQFGDRVSGPRNEPVVGVHDVGLPTSELSRKLGDLMVSRGHPSDEVVVGNPRKVDARPQDAHAVDNGVVGSVGGVQAEHNNFVSATHHGPGEPVDMGGDSANDQWWVFP